MIFATVAVCYVAFSLALASVHEDRKPHPIWKRSLDHHLLRQKQFFKIPLRIGLQQQNINLLNDELMKVADPRGAAYGKHWNPEQVARFFAPSHESEEIVIDWLERAGYQRNEIQVYHDRHWIQLEVTIFQAEQLLNTTYYIYSDDQDRQHIGCDSYSLPATVMPHVEIVLPTVHYPPYLKTRDSSMDPFNDEEQKLNLQSTSSRKFIRRDEESSHDFLPNNVVVNFPDREGNLANCSKKISSSCLRKMYDIGDYKPVATNKNSFGFFIFTPSNVDFNVSDELFNYTSPRVVGTRPILRVADGPEASKDFLDTELIEAHLDYQFSQPFIYPLRVKQHSLADISSFNPILEALVCENERPSTPGKVGEKKDLNLKKCGYIKPPNVISISYGMDEIVSSHFLLTKQCNEYGKLGLMGVTVVVAAGDSGVESVQLSCADPTGKKLVEGGKRFVPIFPASCPFVTAVGGTMLQRGSSVTDPEVALNYPLMDNRAIRGGGGFSDFFQRPKYQDEVLGKYFRENSPPLTSEQFNNSGNSRGYPDISATTILGAHNISQMQTHFSWISGTSCSAPVVGAMLTLINDARLAAGKTTLGFINPSLYSSNFQGAFNDIVVGQNSGCGSNGFPAIKGWDPVTGK
ncbi:putative aorsin endoprotease precursor [Phakopsora pachyrhizi]|uniref:tripeptidyl-peptidase II n=1 Tax=Phakopsora pachyrhizi TaxID=170000 RepID=A0AAV0B2D1_PHAPC|nr:putative aorsin endoprotease precursor [Phakopsora pachyrhizi]CAH7676750.1 putative aorsin endoprotease precursor [Phakopsora pachyrhizi]